MRLCHRFSKRNHFIIFLLLKVLGIKPNSIALNSGSVDLLSPIMKTGYKYPIL